VSASGPEKDPIVAVRYAPCWWTIGILVPALIAIVVIGATCTDAAGESVIKHPLMFGGMGVVLVGFAVSFFLWTDSWAELNRRPRAWMVERFPDAWLLFPLSSPDSVGYRHGIIMLGGFGCLLIGIGFLFGAVIKALGVTS